MNYCYKNLEEFYKQNTEQKKSDAKGHLTINPFT